MKQVPRPVGQADVTIKRRGRPPLRKTRDLSNNAEQALGPLEDKFSEFQGLTRDCFQVGIDCNLSDEKSVKEFKQKMKIHTHTLSSR